MADAKEIDERPKSDASGAPTPPDFSEAEIEDALRPYGPEFVASMQASHPGITRKAIVQHLWATGELG